MAHTVQLAMRIAELVPRNPNGAPRTAQLVTRNSFFYCNLVELVVRFLGYGWEHKTYAKISS